MSSHTQCHRRAVTIECLRGAECTASEDNAPPTPHAPFAWASAAFWPLEGEGAEGGAEEQGLSRGGHLAWLQRTTMRSRSLSCCREGCSIIRRLLTSLSPTSQAAVRAASTRCCCLSEWAWPLMSESGVAPCLPPRNHLYPICPPTLTFSSHDFINRNLKESSETKESALELRRALAAYSVRGRHTEVAVSLCPARGDQKMTF